MVRKSVGVNTDQESSSYTYLWKTWLKLDGKIFHYLLLYWPHHPTHKHPKKKKFRLAKIIKVIVTLICLHVSPPYCMITLISSISLATYDQVTIKALIFTYIKKVLQIGSTGGKHLNYTAEEKPNWNWYNLDIYNLTHNPKILLSIMQWHQITIY